MNKIIYFFLIFATLAPFSSFGKLWGQARIDSCLAGKVRNDSFKAVMYYQLCVDYHRRSPDSGIMYGNQALSLGKQIGWKYLMCITYNSQQQNYQYKGDYEHSMEYAQKALQMSEELGNKSLTGMYLGNLATLLNAQSKFELALEYQFKALKLREEIGDTTLIATSLLNIGNIYVELSNQPKAQQYYLDAIRLFEAKNDKQRLAVCQANIAESYLEQKDFNKALKYSEKTLSIFEGLGEKMIVGSVMVNISRCYLGLKGYNKALEYSQQALTINRAVGTKAGEAEALAQIGTCYLEMAAIPQSLSKSESLDKAIENLQKAKVLSQELGNSRLLIKCEQGLSRAYEIKGDGEKALESYKRSATLKDSVFSKDNTIKTAQLETQREADLKEKQIQINRLSEKDAARKTQLLLAGITVLVLVTITVVRSNGKQKAANQRLEAERETSEKLRADLEETLEQKSQLMEKISDSAAMKSKFFANISHEIRTPVTILTGMLDLMKEESGRGVDKKRLEIAFGNSRRLQYMVEEMLDLSKLESPGTGVKYEIKEVAKIVKRIGFSFSSYMELSNIGFSVESTGIDGILISTDEEKLEKIISNLIYNAVKFNSEEGSITLTARLSDDKKMVTIAVSDTGMGIDEKDLPHIFDRYYQSNSSAAKAKGAGIGLSLVKEFTNLLGGQVHVSSKPGVGTTFTLQFPVFEDQVRETIAGSEFSIPEVNLRFQQPYIILIVEDNAEMRYYLKEVLSGSINLMEAENGKAALAWLANNHADMVISDIMMPEMDGKEFIATLKENDKYRKIPIITVSALSDMENQLGLLGLGVDDYIVKPFNAMELRIRVRNLLVNLEERNAFDRQPAEPDDVSKDSIQAAEFKQKIQDYVLARIKNYDVTVYDVAYEFSLSERQLYRLSKSLTGLTAAQLIKEIRLQKAYELLINRQVAKVETVARELGFENASYFTRQFTERFGKRPSEFL